MVIKILKSGMVFFVLLLCCSKNPIWDRFVKNPYVELGVNGGHAFVNITNERVDINRGPSAGSSYGYTGSGITEYAYDWQTDASARREFTYIDYFSSGRIKNYDEKRTYEYESGGTYEIDVRDIEYNALGRVRSFTAWVDGFEFSYP